MVYEAMEEDKIQEIMSHVVKCLKPYDDKGKYQKPSGEDMPKYPEYYEGYNKAVEQYESIQVHSKVGTFPAKLLGQRSPNMTEEEFVYVKNNYRSWTVPQFIDFSNSVKRMFSAGSYSIIYPDQSESKEQYRDENSMRTYVEKGIKKFGSIENYMKFLYTDLRLTDVNGCIVMRPEDFKKQTEEDAALGFQFYRDETELREPIPFYYNCKRVILPKDEFILIELPEKCEVLDNKKLKKIGRVYELHTENEIFRIYQYGEYSKYTFLPVLLVKHDIGQLQAKIIGGLPEVNDEGDIQFVAEFLYAVGNLDLVLLNKSNLQLANNNGVFPIRVMIGNECEFTQPSTGNTCSGGTLYSKDQVKISICPSCNGSGLKSRITPLGQILIKPKTNGEEQEMKASDAIYSHSTDTTTLEFLLKCIDKDETRAKSILHLKSDDNNTGQNPIESANMAKANAAFIKPITDQICNMWQWILNQCGAWREGDEYKKIKIISPINFDMLTAQDYLAQIKDATSAGAPPFVIRTIVIKFLSTLFYTEQEISRSFKLITEADDLLTLSDNAINTGQTKGTIANWQIILHNSAPNLVSELSRNDPKFFEKDLSEQIADLQELAKQREIMVSDSSAENKLTESNLTKLNGEEQAA